jgi:hypothetical protein
MFITAMLYGIYNTRTNTVIVTYVHNGDVTIWYIYNTRTNTVTVTYVHNGDVIWYV